MKFQSRVGQDAPAASGWSVHAPRFEPLEDRRLLSSVDLIVSIAGRDTDLGAGLDAAAPAATHQTLNAFSIESAATAGDVGALIAGFDLVGSFAPVQKHPAAVVGGTAVNTTVAVLVTNHAEAEQSVPAGTSVNIEVYLRPAAAVDEAQDVLINTKPAVAKAGGLSPGASRALTVSVRIPDTLANGDYKLVLKVDTLDAAAEGDEANNATVGDATIVVADPFVDLTPSVSTRSTIPAALTSGDGTKISLSVEVKNLGNVPTDTTAVVTATVTAAPVGGGAGVPLGTFANLKVGSIKPGAIKTLRLSPLFPIGVDTNQYRLRVEIDTDNAIAEGGANGEANNAATSDAIVDVTEGFVDLAPVILSDTVTGAIVSGSSNAKSSVKVSVTNAGNVNLPKGQTAIVTVLLRPKAGGLGEIGALAGGDVVIGTGTAKLTGLKPNTPRTVVVKSPVPSTLANGQFDLVVDVAPVQDLPETDADNQITGATLQVAAAFTDVSIDPITNPFSASEIEGASKPVTATVRNAGNVAAKGVMSVQFFATTTGSLDGSEVAVSGVIQKTVNLAPNATSPFNGPVTLPSVFADTTYTIIVKMTFAPNVGEPAPVSTTDTATVGVIDVRATPPSIGDLFGTITFVQQTNLIDNTSNPGGFGRTGQVSQLGTLTTSTGLSTTFAYNLTYIAGKIQNASVNLQINPGQITGIGKTLQSIANFLINFPKAANVPLSLVGLTMSISDTKPASFQARANGANILVSGDFFDKNDLYVTIA